MACTKKLKPRLISQKKGNMNYSVDFANPSLHQPKNCPKSQSHYPANNPINFQPKDTSFNLPNAQKYKKRGNICCSKTKRENSPPIQPRKVQTQSKPKKLEI
jgi:hypothetical protein